MQSNTQHDQAFIPASQNLPEITIKAVVLSVILTVVLAAANAYLGLKVGQTVSASIPAAVLAMAILRMFKKHNVLEINIVQTAASAGEALVAGVAFIMPALILIHYWTGFNYWETVLIALIGGILGVLFSVPLRRVLLAEKSLRFPEGTAIGNVLKASASGAKSIKHLVAGSLVGGIISFSQNGLEVLTGSFDYWTRVGSSVVGIGIGLDPAILAAGYIAGINVAIAMIVGVSVAWIIGIPYFSFHEMLTQGSAGDVAMGIWKTHLRFMGVGMMLVGGLWTLVTFLKPMIEGIHASIVSLRKLRQGKAAPFPRTEKDIPINYIMWGILLLCLPLGIIFWNFTLPSQIPVSPSLHGTMVLVCVAFAIIGGFIFSSICGYFTGLVGSSNNPLSGMTLSALILISLLLLALLGYEIHFSSDHQTALNASAFAIIIGGVIAAAAAISNDTIQDLKAGQMVGATPWKQQVMLIIGVGIAALVIPAILNLLFNAYGIGGVFPRPGMDPNQMLSAPQASVMAALVQGIFGHHLPWHWIGLGVIFAAVCVVIDALAKRNNHRFPVLAVALAVYLPIDVSMALILGGTLSWIIERKNPPSEMRQRGLILACGLVAGAAIMGVVLAVPFALEKSADALKIVSDSFAPTANVLGLVVGVAMLIWMYWVIRKGK